ncbi:metal ABC transporter substrate-binding protein [Thiobacter aerophilum]|uniref:Zinc ABC transporter substrate-binding protein n=1 Tax=Thiobacter aerophilum TaxID=3121275 RepID=A0ABV0EFB2_9BURK
MLKKLFAFCLLLLALPAQAALEVFACEPEWAALAREIGGDQVHAYEATTALQDPHRIQARPSLIARARAADLVVCTGADLEVGWLPLVLRQAANPKVQPGRRGYFEAATAVRLLEVPLRVDRAEGDVHPAGNPHIQLDPRNLLRVAEALAARMGELDPANEARYRARLEDFRGRFQAAIARWEKQAAPLRNMPVVVHHKVFEYLFHWLGLKEVAVLEPKPGIEPSAAHLAAVLEALRREPARMVLRASYQDERASVWLAERAGIPAVALPATVGGTPQARDLYTLFDDILNRLLAAQAAR